MICPNCNTPTDLNSINCPHCFVLFQPETAAPTPPPPPQHEIGLPLTAQQSQSLLVGITTRWVGAGVLGTVTTLLYSNDRLPLWALVFWIGIVLWLLYSPHKQFKDYLAGVTEVAIAFLEHSDADMRPKEKLMTYAGHFAGLGILTLATKRVGLKSAGYMYRVIYSPTTRIVWSMEQVSVRIANPLTIHESYVKAMRQFKGREGEIARSYAVALLVVLWGSFSFLSLVSSMLRSF